jgi:hypothetical protein
MKTVNTKIPTKYNPKGAITTFQIKRIMHNCSYQVDTKNEWVQWVTGDVNRTSLKSITQEQAVKIIRQQTGSLSSGDNGETENWGYFDNNNKQHKTILSTLIMAKITVKDARHGLVADMKGWFSNFLKSNKCPVNKPLKQMTTDEVSKIIFVLEQVLEHNHSKPNGKKV